VSGDRVYFGGLDGIVYALDTQSGKQIWKRDLGGRVTTSVALKGMIFTLGPQNAKFIAWTARLAKCSAITRPNRNPDGTFIADDSLTVFLGDEILANLDLPLKKMRWSSEASKEWSSARPYLWHGTVLAGNRRELVALASRDGARVWSHQFPEVVRGVGTSDEVLYVGSLKGPIFAYSPKL
jgi:outer membrane protein assembly factor BamB